MTTTAEAGDRLLDEHEAAAVLGLSVLTLRRWRWAGKPPAYHKIGALVRYSPGDLHALVASGRREPIHTDTDH